MSVAIDTVGASTTVSLSPTGGLPPTDLRTCLVIVVPSSTTRRRRRQQHRQ
jgi:hypothetical protein